MKNEIDQIKAGGEKVVFTNGCFDILHPGHTRYLFSARELGDYLIVAVNSDWSVKAIKGEERPVMPQEERAEVLAALSCVDGVVIFDEDNPLQMIKYLMPDILVKGGDYTPETVVGRDVVEQAGGQVVIVPLLDNASTTEIIDRIRN